MGLHDGRFAKMGILDGNGTASGDDGESVGVVLSTGSSDGDSSGGSSGGSVDGSGSRIMLAGILAGSLGSGSSDVSNSRAHKDGHFSSVALVTGWSCACRCRFI